MPSMPPTHRASRPGAPQRSASDAARGSAHRRGYDAAWMKVRAAVLRERGPRCQAVWDGLRCTSTERPNCDHIVSVVEAPHRRLDPSNLRVLCHRCHSARTARDQSGWGRPGG